MPASDSDHVMTVASAGESGRGLTLDRASDGYCVLDRHWRFVNLSPLCEQLFGRRSHELVETTIWDTCPELVTSPAYAHFHQAAADGVVHSFEINWPQHDAWFSVHAYPTNEGLTVFVRDVTADLVSREQLRFQSELLNAVEHAMITTDATGTIVYWNRHAEAIYGWTADEVLGRLIVDVTVPRLSQEQASAIMLRLLGGESWSGEFLTQRKDGTTFWAHVTDSPMFDDQGKLSGIIGISMDVTEQRVALEALRTTEARHRTLVENIPAVTYTEPIGVATGVAPTDYLSPQITTLTGYPAENWETIPNFGDQIVHPDDRERRKRHIEETEATGDPYNIEYRIIHQEGHNVWLRNEAVLVRDGDGRPLYWQGFITDISEQKHASEALSRSEARLQSLMKNASDTICVLDRAGTIVYQSSSIEHLTGFTPEEIVGGSAADLLHPDDLPILGARMAEIVAVPGVHPPIVYRGRHKDGSWRTIEAIATNLLDDPTIEGIVLNCRDITERQQADAALRESEERFRALVQQGTDLITILDRDGVIHYESPSIEHILGYGVDDLIGVNALSIVHPDDVERVIVALTDVNTQRHLREPVTYRFRHADGSWRWLESTGRLVSGIGGINGAVVNSRDVTERMRLEEELEFQALHDALTGLPNRTLLLDRLDQCIARSHRHDEEMAVLFLDLDDFKLVNDSLGHAAGDDVLVITAQRLSRAIRDGDTVARFGGDEFVIVLGHPLVLQDAIDIANRIAEAIADPFLVDGREMTIAASIGIAVASGEQIDRDELLRHADIALYRAKAKGKNTYNVFNETMHDAVLRRIELDADLRRAIEREEFMLHYQPTVSLATGAVVGIEALVRWQHPEHGVVSPGEFIPLAEETGLILPIGAWILRTACEQGTRWLTDAFETERFTLSVNLSSRQFAQPGLVQQIANVLAETGFPAECLALEITESDAMGDAEGTVRRLEELKALGVQLAVDDFGTGYSSLAYLKRFPVDVLKIDRSFVSGAGVADADKAIVSAVISLARALGLRVVAEGVETYEQLSQLRELGCDQAQGYFFSKSLPAAELTAAILDDFGGHSVAWLGSCPVCSQRSVGDRPMLTCTHDLNCAAG